jgi:hypothetical protein
LWHEGRENFTSLRYERCAGNVKCYLNKEQVDSWQCKLDTRKTIFVEGKKYIKRKCDGNT